MGIAETPCLSLGEEQWEINHEAKKATSREGQLKPQDWHLLP